MLKKKIAQKPVVTGTPPNFLKFAFSPLRTNHLKTMLVAGLSVAATFFLSLDAVAMNCGTVGGQESWGVPGYRETPEKPQTKFNNLKRSKVPSDLLLRPPETKPMSVNIVGDCSGHLFSS